MKGIKPIISTCQYCKTMNYEDSLKYRKDPRRYNLSHGICSIGEQVIEVMGFAKGNDHLIENKEFLEARRLEERNIRDAHEMGRLTEAAADDYIEAIHEEIFEVLNLDQNDNA